MRNIPVQDEASFESMFVWADTEVLELEYVAEMFIESEPTE